MKNYVIRENVLCNLLEYRNKTIDDTQTNLNDLQMLVNKQFDKIEENIGRIILRKLQEKVIESTAAKVSDASYQNQFYASSLRTNPEVVSNFESVIRRTKNNELVQEKE